MDEEKPPVSVANFIYLLAIGLTIGVFLLVQAGLVAASPELLFPVLVISLILLIAFLVKWTYPITPFNKVKGSYEGMEDVNAPVVEESGELATYDQQYQAYKELKQLLINRLKLRRNLTNDSWLHIHGDSAAVYRLLGDEDLLRLVWWDEVRQPLMYRGRPEGLVFGPGFNKRFDYLLKKVESWR